MSSEQHVRKDEKQKTKSHRLRKPQLIRKEEKSRWSNNYMYNAHNSEIYKKIWDL